MRRALLLGALLGYGFLYIVRMLISELKIFKRSLARLLLEHLVMLACALAAFLALQPLAQPLAGHGFALQLLALALSAALLMALGLGADALLSLRSSRRSVGGTLLEILKRGH